LIRNWATSIVAGRCEAKSAFRQLAGRLVKHRRSARTDQMAVGHSAGRIDIDLKTDVAFLSEALGFGRIIDGAEIMAQGRAPLSTTSYLSGRFQRQEQRREQQDEHRQQSK
jgi:hypothetical protein